MHGFGGGHRAIHAIAVGVLMLSRFATAATNAFPDYGPALGLFQSLGLAAAEPGGQYVTLSLDGMSRSPQQPVADVYGMPLAGKAWVWPATNGQPARYLFLGGLGGACRDPNAPPGDDPAALELPLASWRTGDADLAKDATTLLRLLRGPAADAGQPAEDDEDSDVEVDNGEYFRRRLTQGDSSGALLLAAVHLHQVGLKDEANEVVDILFRLAQDRSVVVRQAAAHLANAQYAVAGSRLALSRDWPAYRHDLQAILDRFGLAWDKAPGIELLVAKVDRQIAGQLPAGTGLDEDAARTLAALSPQDVQLFNQLQLAVVLNPAVQLALLSTPDTDGAAHFFARGLHMVPALLAVADSDYLLPAPLQIHSSSHYTSYHYSYSSSSRDQGLKSAEKIFEELQNKPPTLGDSASALLGALIPMRPPESPVSPEESKSNLVAEARAFYAAHASNSPLELATLFLSGGNDQQASAALEILMRSRDSNALARVETYLFSSNFWMQTPYSVINGFAAMGIQSFSTQYPARAAALLPDFLEMVKSELPERLKSVEESRHEDVAQEAKQLLALLVQALRAARGEKEPAPAANTEEPADPMLAVHQASSDLMEKTAGLPPQEAVGVFLDGIIGQPDAATRQYLLSNLLGLYQYHWQDNAAAPRRKERHDIQQVQKWLKLFDDALFLAPDYPAQIAARARAARETAAAQPSAAAPATNAAPAQALSDAGMAAYATQWEVLLADTRYPDVGRSRFAERMRTQPKTTVADSAATTLASIALNILDQGRESWNENSQLGHRLLPYWHQVARAVLAGTPPDALPPLPSADRMSPDAVSNLVAKIRAASSAELPDLFRDLDPDALLALARAASKDKPLRTHLAPAANLVRAIGADADPAFAAQLEPFVGQAFSTNVFASLLETATALATQSVAAVVQFQRVPWLEGATIAIVTNAPGDSEYGSYDLFSESPVLDQAQIFVQCQAPNANEGALWLVDLPAPDSSGATGSVAAAESGMQNMMAQFGVEVEAADLSPEMLAELTQAMAETESNGLFPDNQESQQQLLKTIDQLASGAKSPLTEWSILFQIHLPQAENINHSETGIEIDLEEIIIE